VTFPWADHMKEGALAIPLRRRTRKDGYLNLANNELVHRALAPLLDEVLRSIPPEAARAYAHPPDLVDAIAAHLGVPADRLLVTAGSDAAIHLIFDALFSTAGRVVVPTPHYEQHYSRLRGALEIPIPFRPYPEARFVLDDFLSAVDRGPPAPVMLSNPSGPTGACFSLAEMTALADATLARGRLLVIDEAYVAFNAFDHLALLDTHENVVVVRSFSKAFGVAGLRVGVVAAAPRAIDYLARWNSASTVSGVSAAVVRALLARGAEVARIRADVVAARGFFAAEVERLVPAWRALPSAANFVNFDTGDADAPDLVAAAMRDRGVLIRSMRGVPLLERCVRFTIGDRETMRSVLDHLASVARTELRQQTPHPSHNR